MTSEKRQLPTAVYADPRTLYEYDDESWPRSEIRNYMGIVSGVAFGVSVHAAANYYASRPFRAGIGSR